MDVKIKEEVVGEPSSSELPQNSQPAPVVVLINSDSDSDSYSDSNIQMSPRKRQRMETILPVGFLDPLSPGKRLAMQKINKTPVYQKPLPLVKVEPVAVTEPRESVARAPAPVSKRCKQFWKAGDYESSDIGPSASQAVGMDHVRVHPKFLHSNATSHKWALGALAELLDNSLDEVCNGATYVHIDTLKNKKDSSRMLVVEDDGGGMTPDKIRQCMSLGYSEKSKSANTIGQYGNGFKTSTMRLGADAIVFSRCQGKDRRIASQSIGMLSYTFLRSTGEEDIVVPMIDYEKRGETWNLMIRSTSDDWKRNLETIVQWSPYKSETDLLQQFDYLTNQGTRIIIYNLWEDDQGQPELDFDYDKHDIQIKGVNRDEKNIKMANAYPNSKHFLTYRHSLRNYASILYLRLPPGFRIILRGENVQHHDIVNDMMFSKKITYRPQAAARDPNLCAELNIGFVKDAHFHIDVQGFNVYHKNRLIKPFWRVSTAAGSNGRGVIGVLEANFVEPAHDKQDFERTIVLSRLEARLKDIQRSFWVEHSPLVGYAPNRRKEISVSPGKKTTTSAKYKVNPPSNSNELAPVHAVANTRSTRNLDHRSPTRGAGQEEMGIIHDQPRARYDNKVISTPGATQPEYVSNWKTDLIARPLHVKRAMAGRNESESVQHDLDIIAVIKLEEENQALKQSMEAAMHDLQAERERCRSLENKEVEQDKIEERIQRDLQEEALRSKMQVAADVIQELRDKVVLLERSRAFFRCKSED